MYFFSLLWWRHFPTIFFLFQNLVNELIKNFIIFHEDIFKGRVAGTVYEKYLTPEPEEVLGDSPLDANNPEFIDSEVGEDGKALFVFQFLISWHYTYCYQDSMVFSADAEDSVFTENEEKEDQDLSIELFGSECFDTHWSHPLCLPEKNVSRKKNKVSRTVLKVVNHDRECFL